MTHPLNYSVSWCFPVTHLIEVRRPSLELSSHHEHSLEGPQTKIIVVLSRELPLSQLVQYCHFLGQHLQCTCTMKEEGNGKGKERKWERSEGVERRGRERRGREEEERN